MTTQKPGKILQIKITLQNIKPPIWRRILVPASMKLDDFHLVLQCVMGWTDTHLHQFVASGKEYGTPDSEWEENLLDETRYDVGQLLKKEKDTLLYEYDFGDGWQHQVVLEKVLPFDQKLAVPQCLKGKRACPPEDVGGPWGYTDFLEAIADPQHPEHDELLDWIGGSFDPEEFDLEATNQILTDTF